MIVLLRWREGDEPGEVVVHRVLDDEEALNDRIALIGRANPQYPLERVGPMVWRIGPDFDEGFFGNRPVWFKAMEVER